MEVLNYPMVIRKTIYMTNVLGRLNFSLRKIARNKSNFPDDELIYKIIYLKKKCLFPLDYAKKNWALIVTQFKILFDGVFPTFIILRFLRTFYGKLYNFFPISQRFFNNIIHIVIPILGKTAAKQYIVLFISQFLVFLI